MIKLYFIFTTYFLLIISFCFYSKNNTYNNEKSFIKLGFPVEGKINKQFFIFKYPANLTDDYKENDGFGGFLLTPNHKGTDFAIINYQKPLNVLAACDGIVFSTVNKYNDDLSYNRKKSNKKNYGGNSITIKTNNNWYLHYCHLKKDSICVNKKQFVKKGDIIATIGMSGYKIKLPHLHFSVKNPNGFHINPLNGYTIGINAKNITNPLWEDRTLNTIIKNYGLPRIIIGGAYNKNINSDKILLSALTNNIYEIKNFNFIWCIVYACFKGDIIKANVKIYKHNNKEEEMFFKSTINKNCLTKKIEWSILKLKKCHKIEIKY